MIVGVSGRRATRFDLSPAEVAAVLGDEPAYRARQVWSGIHAGREPEEMAELPAALREKVATGLPAGLHLVQESTSDGGDTDKWLWRLSDGAAVETVLMRYPDRATVCVSTQAGCAMACSFCATGQAGFTRHLTTGEIVEQVVRARRSALPRRLSNVVFMGMGEPLANYGPTWAAVERLHHDLGLSARHITVSTVGLVPGIRRLTAEALPVNLAVSLHAANDGLRDELVPINRRWPLAAHVNLIPLNPTPGYLVRGPSAAKVRAFRDRLRAFGVNATVRRNKGTDIDAACGQLAARAEAGASQPVALSRAPAGRR